MVGKVEVQRNVVVVVVVGVGVVVVVRMEKI